MNNLIANIILCVWLTVSGGIWLLGVLWAGKLIFPPLNGFSLIGIYAPWLVLAAILAWQFTKRVAKQ